MKSLPEEEAKAATRVRCETDFQTFVEMFFAHYCKYPFNQFHRDVFERYGQFQVARREIDGAPRGYAKSTLKSLLKPIHDVCYGIEKYILLVSCKQDQANDKLKDIRREFSHNDALVSVYGIRFSRANPGESGFEVSSDAGKCLFKAVGSRTEVRGLRYGEYRPTKIVLDDVEDSEESQNAELRQKLKDWYFEVIRNLGTNETNIELVGTVLHRDSLLKNLEKNPAYSSRIYKSVISWASNQKLWDEWEKIYTDIGNDAREKDSDMFYVEHKEEMLKGVEVLWPEKEPYIHLMKEKIEIGRRAFMKEKQNEPIASEDALFDNIWWFHEEGEDFVIERTGQRVPKAHLIERCGVIDPATGESRRSKAGLDFTSIVGGYSDPKGRLFVYDDFTKREKPTEYIKQIFEFHERLNFDKFGVEMNLYRNLLMENIVRERKEREASRKKAGMPNWGVRIPFYEIESREKKEKRIYTLEPKVNHGWILFNRTLSVEFMNQVQDFPKGDHDDAPDALEMLWGMVNNRYKASPISMQAMGTR